MGYIFATDSMGLSSFEFLWWALCSKVRYGRSRSSKVIDVGANWKGLWEFLLVINSNLGPILHHFWDMVTYWLKIANLPYPCLVYHPQSGRSLSNFWKSSADPKTRVLQRADSDSEDYVMLACVSLIQYSSVTSTHTHRNGEQYWIWPRIHKTIRIITTI